MSPIEYLTYSFECLQLRLQTIKLRIEDEGYLHVNHLFAHKCHYKVYISSPLFLNLTNIEKHRLVYNALSFWIPEKIHALTIIII